jgi:divinyl chlorophyllide a 8-vinyl-reductase
LTSVAGGSPDQCTKRIFVVGATGTIGRAAVQELTRRGHDVTCFVRAHPAPSNAVLASDLDSLEGVELRYGDVTKTASIAEQGFRGEQFDVLLSCMASRSGNAEDSWRVDYQAHLDVLTVARAAGVTHMVLLSAICVQKPLLAFQHAKLAFEKALVASGATYSIVRPTAFFKSLSGQVERVQKGKPFLVFGNGELTACKPISDDDLARYLADCVCDDRLHNRILPIGGPGPAITPKQQGEMLFSLLGRAPRFRHVPVRMLDVIIGALALVGRFVPASAKKAELARIGRYYATESMLVWNPVTNAYDAAATPSTGTQTLEDHYRKIIAGELANDLGDHSVF